MAYHHGDLRRALLDAAIAAIAEEGVATLSMRDLARRAGVSHAAPTHHFADRAGLLTALAAEGYRLLAEALDAVRNRSGDLVELGVAYVGFCLDHRAHFAVMFSPDLLRLDDLELRAARAVAWAGLLSGLPDTDPPSRSSGAPDPDSLAAWSLVHGFSTLWLSGALPDIVPGQDPRSLAHAVAERLVIADRTPPPPAPASRPLQG
jgi:AcrR family transcriptional regulator